ncbi:hypothetical protein MCOR34_006153 [Pyricularia oryzae]|nr:hypothetical protein MCOR34_006153 [Pyricularia oryzae]KAI6461212.1 hypothetical protein MCOR17_006425 [Pyricularia oryzae]
MSSIAIIRSRKRKASRSSAQLLQGAEVTQSKRLNVNKIIKGDSSHQIVLGVGSTSFTKSDSLGQVGQCVSDQVYTPKGRRWYARKSLPATTKIDSDQEWVQQDRRSFISEIEHLRLLRHKHIARLAGSYTDMEGIAYLMEPVSDTTLDIFLEGHLDHDARILLRQSFGCLAAALGHIHSQSLHIEQLSSDNISVHHGKLFIGGFGALVQNPEDSAYAAPETRAAGDVDGSTRDLWALGIIYLKILMRLHGMRPSEVRRLVDKNSQEAAYGMSKQGSLVSCVGRLIEFMEDQGRARYQAAAEWTSALLREEPYMRPDCQSLLEKIQVSRHSQEFCCTDCRRAGASNRPRKNNNFALVKIGNETLRGLLEFIPYFGPKQPYKGYHVDTSSSTKRTRTIRMGEVKSPGHKHARPVPVRQISEEELPWTRATSSTMLGFVRDSGEWSPMTTDFQTTAGSRPLLASAYDHDDQESAYLQHSQPEEKGCEISPIPSFFSPPSYSHQASRETSPAPPDYNPPPRESDEVVAQNLNRSCINGEASNLQIHLEEALERQLDSACQAAWFKAVCGASKKHNDCVRVFLETAGSEFVHLVEPGPGRRTALLLAADNPNLAGADLEELVGLLLRHGADSNVVDSRGDHALAKLIRRGGDTSRTIEVIARVQSTDLNKPVRGSGDSPLHLAVEQANVAVVLLLLHLGADVDPINTNGETPLEAVVVQVYNTPGMRASREQAEIVHTLFDAGARQDGVKTHYLAQKKGIA